MKISYFITIFIINLSLNLKAEDKHLFSDLELDKLLGYSCASHELGQAYQDAQKSKKKAGDYLNERLGGNNLTHCILTHRLSELTHLDLKLNSRKGIPQIVRNARICDHKDVVRIKRFKEDEKEILGEILIHKDDIIETRLLFRYNKIKKKVLSLSIAKKGSNKMLDGYTAFDETYSGRINNRKIFKVDQGTVDQGVFKNSFFEFSLKIPKDYEVVNKEEMDSLEKKSEILTKDQDSQQVKHKTIHLLIRQNKPEDENHTSLTIMTMTNHDTFTIKKSIQYATYLKRGMSILPFMKFKGEPEEVKVNDLTMTNLKLIVKTEELPEAQQEYFITMKYGKAVAIIINYRDEKNREKLINIVKTFNISK